VDVTREDDVRALVGSIIQKHGRIDALVNAVGGYGGGKLWEGDAALLDRMLNLNLRSGYVLSRAVVPVMLARGPVRSSTARGRLSIMPAGLAAMRRRRQAAVALIDSLAADLAGTGVRANSIVPSIIDTPANRKAMPAADFSEVAESRGNRPRHPFLCGDDAPRLGDGDSGLRSRAGRWPRTEVYSRDHG
jgi:NAD(P)-dependent dehydrogenase (short-subunit alcohol dehydrogenase family)